ncbi:MAG: hypothetical protein ACKVTZ_07675 [Bacteroidia bacterium]
MKTAENRFSQKRYKLLTILPSLAFWGILLLLPKLLLGSDINVFQTIEKGNKARNDGNHELALRFYLEVYPYLTQFPDTSHETVGFYQGLTVLFESLGATEMALKYAKQAYTYELQRKGEANLYLRAGQIATLYLRLSQFDSANYYFKQGLRLAKNANEPFFVVGAYNNLGILKFRTQAPDAKSYYDTAFALIQQGHYEERGIFASVNDNLAELFMANGEYEKALAHCKIIEDWLVGKENEQNGRRPISVQLKKAECLWKLKQTQTALQILAETQPLFVKTEFAQMEKQCYQLLVEIYKEIKQPETAMIYQDKLIQLVTKNLQAQNALTNKALEDISKMRLSSFQKELEYTQLKASETKRRTFFIVLGVILIAGIGYVFYRRKMDWQQTQFLLAQNQKQIELKKEQLERENTEIQLKKEQLERENAEVQVVKLQFERENAEILLLKEQMDKANMELRLKQEQTEKENIAISLEYRKKELANTLNYLSDGREWNEKLLERLAKIDSLKDKEKAHLIRETMMDIRNRLVVDDKLHIVHENMHILNQEFYAKMREKYPDLSLTELELCAYFRMNLANKDIASLRNTSLKAVQMGRYRIRKKLGIESEEDIYAFLQAM